EKDGTLHKCRIYSEKNNLPVSFPGKLKKREWAAIAVDYNIFLNTTNIDNTPISVIESMALGLAIVSTDVGGMHYLVEDNQDGILVPQKDEDAMVAAVKHIIAHPEESREMTIKARHKVTSFDWEVVKDKWNQLLE